MFNTLKLFNNMSTNSNNKFSNQLKVSIYNKLKYNLIYSKHPKTYRVKTIHQQLHTNQSRINLVTTLFNLRLQHSLRALPNRYKKLNKVYLFNSLVSVSNIPPAYEKFE
jgi:hypothetical protein